MANRDINLNLVTPIIQRALEEDIGKRDITSEALRLPSLNIKGEIIAKEEGILAGIEICKQTFKMLSPLTIKFTYSLKDGKSFKKEESLLIFEGDALAIFKGERVALNFLSHLSGIATLTKKYVDLARPYGVKIADTRKTLPNLRIMEKYAVRVGGGINHRFSLDDGILIKDNHIKIYGGVKETLKRIQRNNFPFRKIEIEVDNLSEIGEAIEGGAEIIMLDNMSSIEEIKKATDMIRKKKRDILIEVSGEMSLDKVEKIAQCGVDIISVGRLTHSVKSLNMSLELIK